MEQGTQKTEFIQLTNPGSVPRTATLEVINPHSDLTVSLIEPNPVSIAPGETKTLSINLDASTSPVGVYDDLLLKVTTDDGSTLYASLKVYVTPTGAGQLPDLAITANDIRSTANADGTVTLTADIHNSGLAPAENVQVQFYEFGNALGSPVTVAQIAPNGVGTTSITIPALADGDHLIRVAVNPAGAIAELDKTNNEASRLIAIGSSGPPTEGNILVTGSLPATVYTDSLFTLNGRAVYDLYVNGVRYTDYVVKGGSVQITVKAEDGTEWVYGDVYTDVYGNFSKALQAPTTPGTYRIVMTVTDKTFVGTRELVFIATEPPPAGALPPLQSPPAEWGSGYFEWDGVASQWVWTWTNLLLTGPVPQQDVFVYSKDLYFSKNNPSAGEEITVFAAIRYWASSSALIAQNVPVNVYATYPGTPKVQIGQTLLKSLSVGSPDFGARYVYATWKNQGDGIYLIEFAIDPSYVEANLLNNAATRAIIVGQIPGIPQGVIAGQVIAPLGGLGNVVVHIIDATGAQTDALTDATGFYHVDNVPVGAAQISIDTPSGYVPDAETKTTTVTNQEVSTVDFRLTTQPADTTAPVITPTVTGTLGNNGWYTGDVTVSWEVTDDESPITVTDGCQAATVTTDTTGRTFTCSATSSGGTATESVTIKRDATAPVVGVTGVADGASYPLGSVPTAGCATTDALSGVQAQAALSVTGGTNGVGTFTARCTGATDKAGNAGATASVTYQVYTVDNTPPVIAPIVNGTLGNNDWYIGNVSVGWTVTDGESAITAQNGCDTATVATDTAGVTFTCSATSGGGTASKAVTVKRDATPPTVGVTGIADGASYPLGAVPTAGCATTDALSGVQAQATLSVTGGDASGLGTFTASCTGALDNAGNAGATASATYTVTSAPPDTSTFSAFGIDKLGIDQRYKTFALFSKFTLGTSSNGIDPVKEPVTLTLANFTTTIPAGSFRKGHLGVYAFAGKINNVAIEVLIVPLGNNRFGFQAAAYGANLSGTKNPVTVKLMIGNDSGTTSVSAIIR